MSNNHGAKGLAYKLLYIRNKPKSYEILRKCKTSNIKYIENLYEEPIALIGYDGFCEGL